MYIPVSCGQWTDFLANWKKLISYLAKQLEGTKNVLKPGETLFFGGCSPDHNTYMTKTGELKEVNELRSNHEEADTRIFCHAKWSKKQVIQIVYNI